MKILFLLSRIEKSGVALHTLDLAEGIVEQGHELMMITGGITDHNNDYLMQIYNRFLELGVEIKFFKTPKGNIVSKVFTSILSTLQILGWLVGTKADVIHSQSPYMTFLPWLLRKKYVTTVHNVQLIKNIMYKNPTRLIAISRESKQYAIEQLGAKPTSISVVCHGISKRYAAPILEDEKIALRNKYSISQDSIVLGFVGRITIDKGLDILIDAVEKHLPTELTKSVHLVFLGDYFHDKDKKWLGDIIDKSALSKKINIVAFQDPRPFYAIFDIFVLPSKSEAFGLVCVEAMMSGCCTVRTDTNGAVDQINHGKDGFIFPNGDSQALAKILEQIIHDPELRYNIAQKGKKKALENFTIKAMTTKTMDVYKKII